MAAWFIFGVVCVFIFHNPLAQADDTELSSLVTASNQFSQKLFPYVSKTQSWVYSPSSVHSEVSLASLGAYGPTETEMRQVLAKARGSSLHSAHFCLFAQQRASSASEQMVSANAVFVHLERHLVSDFVKSAAFYYDARVANFESKASKKMVNQLVAEINNYAPNVLPSDSMNEDTAMALVNTVYFSGAWDKPFNEDDSEMRDFTKSNGATVSIPTMQTTRIFRIKQDSALHTDVLQLTFNNTRFSLYFALPHAAERLHDLEKSLETSAENLESLFHGFQELIAYITIPKFKIETTLDLVPALRKLGMKKAFDCSGAANFSGVSSEKTCISRLIHKAMLEVTESGTMGSTFKNELRTPQVPRLIEKFFNADRPFLFFLRDDVNEWILFQGKFLG